MATYTYPEGMTENAKFLGPLNWMDIKKTLGKSVHLCKPIFFIYENGTLPMKEPKLWVPCQRVEANEES